MKQIVEVVAALIWDKDKFLICQRPANKARALLWEFVGGKVEPGETKEEALVRECQEELAITLSVGDVFTTVVHEYPDIKVNLTLFNATIAEGTPQRLEHNDIQWITPSEIPNYTFCPADEEILEMLKEIEYKFEILRLLKEGKSENASQYAYGAREIVYRKDGPVDLSNEYTLYGYKGTRSVVIIPSRIGRKPVTAVGVPDIWKNYTQTAFWNVDTVIISEGIRELNRFAFSIVNTLKHIYLPDTLEYVAENALLYHTDTTIYCSKNNILAQEVAEQHSFKCVILDI